MWRAALALCALQGAAAVDSRRFIHTVMGYGRRSSKPSATQPHTTWFGRRPIDAPGEVCYVVFTAPQYHVRRCQAIRDTWGANAHILGWASDAADPLLPGSFVVDPVKGKAKIFGAKALAAFWWLMQNEHISQKCQWFSMVDDDTYVVLPRMRHFFAALDPDYPAAYGAVLPHLNGRGGNSTDRDILSGGAGMVISRGLMTRWENALRLLRQCDGSHGLNLTECRSRVTLNKFRKCNYNHSTNDKGDVALSWCWKALEADFVDVSGVHPLRMDAWFGRNPWCKQTWWVPGHKDNPSRRKTYMSSCKPDPRVMTLHYVSAQEMPFYHDHIHTGTSKLRAPSSLAGDNQFEAWLRASHKGILGLRAKGEDHHQNHTATSGRQLPRIRGAAALPV